MLSRWLTVLLVCCCCPPAFAGAPKPAEPAKPGAHDVRKLEGWTIRVDERLLEPANEELFKKAWRFLENKLADIKVVVAEDRVKKLQGVTIVLDLSHGKLTSMQYHPSAGWLKGNGYAPDLAKCVHLPRAADLATRRNIREQPWVILHELAHAYHDQVLGFDNPRIREAFENYKKSGHGDKTLLYNGKRVRHYALTNPMEFFAEMTEAYFGVNDFFPFNRAELQEAEPQIYTLLRDIWDTPPKAEGAKAAPFRFFAMDTGLRGPDVPDLQSKVSLLKKLGYTGIGFTYNPKELPALLKLIDENGLELAALYMSPSIEDKLDPTLVETVKLLKGRKTLLEMALRSKKLKPSDPGGDEQAVALLKELADLVGDSGPVVSVYPHTNFWAERVDDGIRLAKKVDRKNVGTHFNLVHWKWVKQSKELPELLKEAQPFLKCVTINGLAERKIVSLDQGDYDIEAFLKRLQEVGYRGPVGLQGYSVPGPSAEHLGRSITRWRQAVEKLQAQAK